MINFKKSVVVISAMILFWFLQINVSVAQPQARKYPSWVYVPQEKKGMISAIAYAYGDSHISAIENAKQKATRQLYLHLSSTINAITLPEDAIQPIDSGLIKFRDLLLAKISSPNIQTVTREMYVEEEGEHCKAIILIDTNIRDFTLLISGTLDATGLGVELSPERKKWISRRVRYIKSFIEKASLMTLALH